MDASWWGVHRDEVATSFSGDKYSVNPVNGVRQVKIDSGRNSGLGAIRLAILYGATRVILIGYDCQHTNGKKHWHGDHPVGLGNAGSVQHWPMRFVSFARRLPEHIKIINASRETALECFEKQTLEQALCNFTSVGCTVWATTSTSVR